MEVGLRLIRFVERIGAADAVAAMHAALVVLAAIPYAVEVADGKDW